MPETNASIMTASYLQGTDDFKQRVPDPTISGMANTAAHLFDVANANLYGAWSENLVNNISATEAVDRRFVNPLAIFRRADMPFGYTIQQVAVQWAKAHAFIDDDETLLKYERPEFTSVFHSISRADHYDQSFTRAEAKQSILGNDEYGLNRLLDMLTSSQTNAEQYDEMQIMINSIALHDKFHTIHREHIDAMPTDKASGQAYLAKVKELVGLYKFPNVTYNAKDIDIPCFASPDELVIITTPKTNAAVDVYAYAELFNLDRAEINARVIELPYLPFPNAAAILTTKDVFVATRSEYGMYAFWNPQTLTTKQMLHSQGVYSINPFVPMTILTTDEVTAAGTIVQETTGVTITPESENIKAGGDYRLAVKLDGTITDNDDGITVEPNAVYWSVSGETAAGEVMALNSRTRVDRNGILHVQKSDLEAGDKINVVGTTAYTNPSGTTTEYTKTVTLTVE